MQWFNRFPLVVLLKYVLIRLIAENDSSQFCEFGYFRQQHFWLLFFPKFSKDSNNFVTVILLVSKKATVKFSQGKFERIFVAFLVNCVNKNILYVFVDLKIRLVEALLTTINYIIISFEVYYAIHYMMSCPFCLCGNDLPSFH